MKYTLIKLQQGISRLKVYIEGITSNKSLLKEVKKIDKSRDSYYENLLLRTEKHLEIYLNTDLKVFEYTTIMINLYGLLERFIEDVICEYIDYLSNSIPSYTDLPKEIIDNHYELSGKLINSLSLPKYKDLITKEVIITRLYSCKICNGNKQYKINTEAFTQHSYNFRENSINDFFKNVGISNLTSLIKKNNHFKLYIEENGIENSNAFEFLNDLANRRNRISHGSEESNILDIQEMKRYIEYIERLALSTNHVLIEEALPKIKNHGDNLTLVGSPIQCFSDKILGIEVYNIELSIGERIIIENEKGTLSLGIIESIEIDGAEQDKIISKKEKTKIAIKFNCKIKDNSSYYKIIF